MTDTVTYDPNASLGDAYDGRIARLKEQAVYYGSDQPSEGVSVEMKSDPVQPCGAEIEIGIGGGVCRYLVVCEGVDGCPLVASELSGKLELNAVTLP